MTYSTVVTGQYPYVIIAVTMAKISLTSALVVYLLILISKDWPLIRHILILLFY